ncbi:uncharacterized protein LOC110108576 isoform X1 [Dendrobium catenatum]|uniref:Fungal lipase-type domain-containing protein n=2 Tax=Dendrobium catenatum TaxID=906689 RepID=A0A2I0WCT8_9ASPA|nr:uncharacterized protein LOC110108576 isoform X1 [Dendrobium catenatum]PKU73452.1 hypothetical protein MA16_Dca013908 [Dendrobium catenatum]
MESIYSRVESWIKDQTARIGVSWLPPAPPRWHWPRWPPWKGQQDRREQERLFRQEYERQRRQLHDLCRAAKAESIADLQEILCSMVLAECVYKRPATEMIRALNKFKSDFGGQLVSLERVQHSLDHVAHRYLLAEAGDTLFASFIGTKQYKDVITDANFFQGAIFHEDDEEDLEAVDVMENDTVDSQAKIEVNILKSSKGKPKRLQKNAKPAAHRGFLARAKGIPALEIYRLAQKKNRNLVLCGHSLGGAVAALATLAILRVLASSSISQGHGKVQVKCITFSQPPVGNAALKDYVHQKGWQKYFKSYCIPEDLVPRLLSPAYFHHYNSQSLQSTSDAALVDASVVNFANSTMQLQTLKSKGSSGEQLVLGLGPVQMPFWRLSKLVTLEGVRKHLNILRRGGSKDEKPSSIVGHNSPTLLFAEAEAEPQSLEIQEGAEGISLKPISDTQTLSPEGNSKTFNGRSGVGSGYTSRWKRVPYLPSYVPFGQLFLLRNSSVELLSDAEYSKLLSVSSVISELKERLQSHSMRSYRFRFHKIYEQCMCINAASFLGIEQLPQFPHLQQLLGLRAAGDVELGHIVDPPIIRTATSILPLGWSGMPANNNAEPLKVDIIGHGLHMCTLFQAQVNGKWCSTAVETLPTMPSYSSNIFAQPDLQKMRLLIGAPLKRPPKYPADEILPLFSYPAAESIDTKPDEKSKISSIDGLADFFVYCTSDFISVPKQVHARVRRVRLLGLQGAGKTSLLKAMLDQNNRRDFANIDWVHPQESFIDGLCYLDSAGVKLQELHSEARKLSEELREGTHDLSKKIDLVVLVHNLSQQIPRYHQSSQSTAQPALTTLLNEVKTFGTPWVLAITNKFSVSAREQKMLVKSAMEAYQTPPTMAEVVNSCPFVVPIVSNSTQKVNTTESNLTRRISVLKLILAPINLARIPFQRKDIIFPIEGIAGFRKLVRHVLHSHEELAFQELANERLALELARETKIAVEATAVSQEKGSSITAAAVGASLGAGLGLIMAVVMGAASALRKP